MSETPTGETLVRNQVRRWQGWSGDKRWVRPVDSTADLVERLRLKLIEETREFLESSDPEELIDIMEVVFALAFHRYGITPDQLETARRGKVILKGDFSTGFVLAGREGK